jgi:PBP1b-binding outer membrane lipoprotein LpoB
MNKLTLSIASALILSLAGCSSSGGGSSNDDTPPELGTIDNISIEADTNSGSIAIDASDNKTDTDELQVDAYSSNQQVIADDGLIITSSGNSINLVVSPVSDTIGTSTITVAVEDKAGNVASTTFSVTVNTRQEDGFALVQRITQLDANDAPEFLNQVAINGIIDDATGFDALVNQ